MSRPRIKTVSDLLTAIEQNKLHGIVDFPAGGNMVAFFWLKRLAAQHATLGFSQRFLKDLFVRVHDFHGLSLACTLNLSLFEFRKLLREAGVPEPADTKTDKKKKVGNNLPQNLDVCRLAKDIKRKLGNPGFPTIRAVALEFTDSDKKRAESLLRSIRRYKHLLE